MEKKLEDMNLGELFDEYEKKFREPINEHMGTRELFEILGAEGTRNLIIERIKTNKPFTEEDYINLVGKELYEQIQKGGAFL